MDNFNEDLNQSASLTNEEVYKRVNKFNFGAFTFGWIWGLFNGVYKLSYIQLFCIAFSLIGFFKFFAGIGCFILAIIFGVQGNLKSYEEKDWQSLEKFEETQKKWNIAGIICFVIIILYNIFILCTAVNTISNVMSGDFHNKLLVEEIMANDKLKYANSGEELANYIYEKESKSYKKYNKNSLMYINKRDSSSNKIIISFNKAKFCTLKAKNCSVTTYWYVQDSLINNTKTYYDSIGKTQSINLKKAKK